MKSLKRLFFIFTVIMLAALWIIIRLFDKAKLVVKSVASYSGRDLEIYKQIWDNTNESFAESKHNILMYVLVFWGLILILGYALMVFIYFAWIKPIREMEGFASEIAKGNLDIELPIHKRNLFGTFTDSFDMMREALRASREREIESEKARKELVAALSHDIKTPVATIKAACEVLDMQLMKKAEEGNPDASNMLDKVQIISSKADLIDGLVSNIFHATLEELEKIEVSVKEEKRALACRTYSVRTTAGVKPANCG